MALAEAYTNYAWEARGRGYANQVTAEGWNQFGHGVQAAREILEQASGLKEKCPQWYRSMQSVALAQGWSLKDETALLQKAVAFEADYYYYYQGHARYLLPKWHGEPGDVERFAEQAANRIGGARGDAVYYKIAAEVTCECEGAPTLSWPRIQKGFAALKGQYGTSAPLLNDYARMAVHYRDAAVAKQTFLKIGDDWDPGVWGTEEFFQSSRAWASASSN